MNRAGYRHWRPLLVATLLVAAWGVQRLWLDDDSPGAPAGVPARQSGGTSGEAELAAAFAEERSGIVVEAGGIVERLLADDDSGSRHQRFILRLAGGQTLLISHNIDLAERVPLAVGDAIEFRGQYEWNERGGVIHWTHHDPQGRRPGGWIRHRGRDYR